MKKISAILAVLLLAAWGAGAQNNPYAIDDECYKWFLAAEQALDDFETDAFEKGQQKLLETSLRKKDAKAQTLYYVHQLKRTSHLAQMEKRREQASWDNIVWNARMEEERETLQRIAKATGYMQYYHYANELCQTYYYNTSQDVVASELLVSVMQEAKEAGDEYGMWQAQIYLGRLYLRICDKLNTRKYFGEAVRVYEKTEDPTIRRQGITVAFCELADTYPVASDSARMFYAKAEQAIKTRADSVRVSYYKAQLAAWDGDLTTYRRLRDHCLNNAIFHLTIREGNSLFACVDNILDGKPLNAFRSSVNSLYIQQQYSYVTSLAIKHRQWETASAVMTRLIDRLYNDIFGINTQRLDHMSTQYEQNRLSSDLERATRKNERTRIWVGLLLSLVLVEALVFILLYRRERKKNLKNHSE